MGGAYQWPEVREVMEYRRTVKELVTDLINSAPLELPVTTDHPWVGMVAQMFAHACRNHGWLSPTSSGLIFYIQVTRSYN